MRGSPTSQQRACSSPDAVARSRNATASSRGTCSHTPRMSQCIRRSASHSTRPPRANSSCGPRSAGCTRSRARRRIRGRDSAEQPTLVEGHGAGDDQPEGHFLPVPGANHFSILAPTTELIVEKLKADQGSAANLAFSNEELRKLPLPGSYVSRYQQGH